MLVGSNLGTAGGEGKKDRAQESTPGREVREASVNLAVE